jgi:hypothetical protein
MTAGERGVYTALSAQQRASTKTNSRTSFFEANPLSGLATPPAL